MQRLLRVTTHGHRVSHRVEEVRLGRRPTWHGGERAFSWRKCEADFWVHFDVQPALGSPVPIVRYHSKWLDIIMHALSGAQTQSRARHLMTHSWTLESSAIVVKRRQWKTQLRRGRRPKVVNILVDIGPVLCAPSGVPFSHPLCVGRAFGGKYTVHGLMRTTRELREQPRKRCAVPFAGCRRREAVRHPASRGRRRAFPEPKGGDTLTTCASSTN
ncbi:hypothetical protein C8Q80DRAFT_680293 [Daedaleopsis nitida]|nr:hypothetical protein C8Q80DRAFT_680293 [Daedaleopsis nitida]